MEEFSQIKQEFAFQERWLKILLRGKFLLQDLPSKLIIAIITKTDSKSFCRLNRTCKWIHCFIRDNRKQILIFCETWLFLDNNDSYKRGKKLRGAATGYRFIFNRIWVENYDKNKSAYLKLLSAFRYGNICAQYLIVNMTPMTTEIMVCFRPNHIEVHNWKTSIPINFPLEILKSDVSYKLDVKLDNDEGSFVNLMASITHHCLSFIIKVKQTINIDTMLNSLKTLLEAIAEQNKKYRSELYLYKGYDKSELSSRLHSWPENFYVFEKDSRNSIESDFNFFVLAQAPVGTVGILLPYGSSRETRSDCKILCEYLPTFKDFRHFIEYSGQEYEAWYPKSWEKFGEKVKQKFYSDEKCIMQKVLKEDVFFDPCDISSDLLTNFNALEIDFEPLHRKKSKWRDQNSMKSIPRTLPKFISYEESNLNNADLQLILNEAREYVEIRKKWSAYFLAEIVFRLNILQRGKFILELVPVRYAIDIVKKMKTKAFIESLRSSKWLSKAVEKERSLFVKYLNQNWIINKESIGVDELKSQISQRENFYFNEIQFEGFSESKLLFRQLLKCFDSARVFTNVIKFDDCLLVEDVLAHFYPNDTEKSSLELRNLRFQAAYNTTEHVKVSVLNVWKVLKHLEIDVEVLFDYYHPPTGHLGPGVLLRDLFPSSDEKFAYTATATGPNGMWQYTILMEKTDRGAIAALSIYTTRWVEYMEIYDHQMICAHVSKMEKFRKIFAEHIKTFIEYSWDWLGLEEENDDEEHSMNDHFETEQANENKDMQSDDEEEEARIEQYFMHDDDVPLVPYPNAKILLPPPEEEATILAQIQQRFFS